MAKVEPLGIRRLEALHYYVKDLERSRAFYTKKLDFAEIGCSGPELEARGGQRSAVFSAGDCTIMCSQPLREGGRAWRYLKKHPDGVGTLMFEVEDVEKAFALLDARGGTPIDDVVWHPMGDGKIGMFSITTPFGSSTFRFIERRDCRGLLPGLIEYEAPQGGTNAFGLDRFDHITANFETMAPAILWLEHVIGFEEFWAVQFHTGEGTPAHAHASGHAGSGLRSRVMWDPQSKVKLAINEPRRPFFKSSQINVFAEEQRGSGFQHAAISARDILETVRGLRGRGLCFMDTPDAYYEMLPERLTRQGVWPIEEDPAELRKLGILVDGKGKNAYLLQIFLRDSAGTHGDPEAGPFFFEIIQRKGDPGFGEGNFRALFESIEREQTKNE